MGKSCFLYILIWISFSSFVLSMDIEKVHLGASLELQDPEHQHGTFYDVCNSLLSAEARIFIDNHDDHTLLNSTFPSKTITIADLMILQSKFGTPLSINVVAKVSNLNVDAKFKKFIRTKINFVKNGWKQCSKDIHRKVTKSICWVHIALLRETWRNYLNMVQVIKLLKLLLLKKWFIRVQLISFARSLNLIADTSSVSILVIFLVCWSCWGC